MFRLTNKLAVSNLIKNRKLYYPFALAVLLAVTITYLFYSLTLNPNIGKIRGGETISMTLGLRHEKPFQRTRDLWHVRIRKTPFDQHGL